MISRNNLITVVFTAKPKQKGCGSYSEKYILEELNLYYMVTKLHTSLLEIFN